MGRQPVWDEAECRFFCSNGGARRRKGGGRGTSLTIVQLREEIRRDMVRKRLENTSKGVGEEPKLKNWNVPQNEQVIVSLRREDVVIRSQFRKGWVLCMCVCEAVRVAWYENAADKTNEPSEIDVEIYMSSLLIWIGHLNNSHVGWRSIGHEFLGHRQDGIIVSRKRRKRRIFSLYKTTVSSYFTYTWRSDSPLPTCCAVSTAAFLLSRLLLASQLLLVADRSRSSSDYFIPQFEIVDFFLSPLFCVRTCVFFCFFFRFSSLSQLSRGDEIFNRYSGTLHIVISGSRWKYMNDTQGILTVKLIHNIFTRNNPLVLCHCTLSSSLALL